TNVFEKQVADTIEEKGYTPEEKYTFKYIEGYDAKTPTQVLSKFLKVRRNMIGKIQDYKLKDVKVKGNDATVTFTSRSVGVGVAFFFSAGLLEAQATRTKQVAKIKPR
ncbi:MAG: hypothetical protein E6X73_10260, partial [Streptococcus parasanguinis]|nr:hypothetical protein [Streptococcus parasanguinis]